MEGLRQPHCMNCGGDVRTVDEHTLKCNYCGSVFEIVKYPTCVNEGKQQRTCTCGETETRTMPSLGGHKPGEWQTVKFATCIEKGEQKRVCSCGETETKILPALGGHQPGEWTVIKQPSENEPGLKVRTCRVCGERVEKAEFSASSSVKEQKTADPVASKLAYKVNSDRTTCTVLGLGTCTDTHVVIPDTIDGYRVTMIDRFAFQKRTNLISVTIPGSVTSIGYSAFQDCTGITNMVIPNSVGTIGNCAFWGCKNLTNVSIPTSLTSIGENMFRGCKKLESVVIPGSVTSIGAGAFKWCENLSRLTIHNSVKQIGKDAFYGCKNLSQIQYKGTVKQWKKTNIKRVILSEFVTRTFVCSDGSVEYKF